MPALLIVDDRIKIQGQVLIRCPLERTGKVPGFILEIVVVLVKKLDRQKIERLGACGTATRSHVVIAVGTGTEGGDILLGNARAQNDSESSSVRGPVVAPGT